ncbi:MAG TPA: hypothetical protein VG672_15785 [Bryobacteraceae bacterium]|nr:hypothetical protein [Bryobacteraceae bacterium]
MDLSRLTWLVGPRFTYNSSRVTKEITARNESHLFGQILAGGTHAFDSVFPRSGGATSSAGSYAFQAGGGFEVGPASGLHVRPLELNYVRTALPNSTGNTQNDLQLSFGMVYGFR